MKKQYLLRDGKPGLAYVYSSSSKERAHDPLVIFLGGFKSDMEGTKATYIQGQCRGRGQAFLRFDYAGHGSSDGAFKDGTIGSWFGDALDMLDHISDGKKVVLVGSSMGGWIALLMVLARPEMIKGMVGIAAAPDFTKGLYEEHFDDAQRSALETDGYVEEANEYSREPYIFTRGLIEDGMEHCLLDRQHIVSCPIHLLQGEKDTSVHWKTALKIKEVFGGDNVLVDLIQEGDHSLSTPEILEQLDQIIQRMSA